jgi:hypothetical protein
MNAPLVPTHPQPPDLMTLAEMFARSGYFADAREQAQAIVKILAGQELGFPPVVSMTGIYIVKGRVTMSANLIAAAIKRSGKYDYRPVKITDEICSLMFYELGQEVGLSDFTIADARVAGVISETYRKYPRNMLFARAISNGAKWYCPDVFATPVYTPDEVGALVDAETGEMISPPPEAPAPVTTVEKDKPVEKDEKVKRDEKGKKALDLVVERWQEEPPPERVEPPGKTLVEVFAGEPERNAPQLRLDEPPSETALAYQRSLVLEKRNKLKLTDADFAQHVQAQCGIGATFARLTMAELQALEDRLASLLARKGKKA